ncbi:MAG: hypothetical protein LBK13_10830 [Spirochaetales bacterium]|jgi:hypothetical protein|nr:hypothetical protein [Spirochaetales bacterium]
MITEVADGELIKISVEVMENNTIVDYSPLKNIVKDSIKHGFILTR